MLVPLGCPLHDEYRRERGGAAIDPNKTISGRLPFHEISASGQPCEKFGLLELPFVKELYDQGGAAIMPNIGTLTQPTTRHDLSAGTARLCHGIGGHSDGTRYTQSIACATSAGNIGAGGRIADALARGPKKYRASSFSITGSTTFLRGYHTGVSIVDPDTGPVRFVHLELLNSTIRSVTEQRYGNIYAEEFAQQLQDAITDSETLGDLHDSVKLETHYSAKASVDKQLRMVAKLIALREARKAERDLFVVSHGGFDMHSTIGQLPSRMRELNSALERFVTELKAQGLFDNVVIATQSEFGRTISFNGVGTDHGHAGNHIIMGGSLRGGRFFNTYPETIALDGDGDFVRGRSLIPEYPWESMMAPIAEWMGVEASQMDDVFPNLNKFSSKHIHARTSVFSN
jgi:uncharacterized protein (DUF1501 family)